MDEFQAPDPFAAGSLQPPDRHPPTAVGVATPPPPPGSRPRRSPTPSWLRRLRRGLTSVLDLADGVADLVAGAVGLRGIPALSSTSPGLQPARRQLPRMRWRSSPGPPAFRPIASRAPCRHRRLDAHRRRTRAGRDGAERSARRRRRARASSHASIGRSPSAAPARAASAWPTPSTCCRTGTCDSCAGSRYCVTTRWPTRRRCVFSLVGRRGRQPEAARARFDHECLAPLELLLDRPLDVAPDRLGHAVLIGAPWWCSPRARRAPNGQDGSRIGVSIDVAAAPRWIPLSPPLLVVRRSPS